jgi:putative transcriptional regulator
MNKRKDHNLKKEIVKTPLENEILEALADFTDALEKGEVTKRFTCRQIKLNLVPTRYNPELVKHTRKILGVSQALFARFLGISPKTVRAWEQGANNPHPMACRFMDEIRLKPSYWNERLREITLPKDNCAELPL